MIFTETKLKGALIIDFEPQQDRRGFFARTFCSKEFAAYGLRPNIAQCNLSYNYKRERCEECTIKLPQQLK